MYESLCAYLTDEVMKLPGFTTKVYPDKSESHSFYGDSLSKEGARWYMHLGSGGTVPEELKGCVEKISMNVSGIPCAAHRYTGIYAEGDVEGTLEIMVGQGKNVQDTYSLHIVGKSVEGVCALYRKIRAGTIVPTENWEAPQVAPPLTDSQKSNIWRFVQVCAIGAIQDLLRNFEIKAIEQPKAPGGETGTTETGSEQPSADAGSLEEMELSDAEAGVSIGDEHLPVTTMEPTAETVVTEAPTDGTVAS